MILRPFGGHAAFHLKGLDLKTVKEKVVFSKFLRAIQFLVRMKSGPISQPLLLGIEI